MTTQEWCEGMKSFFAGNGYRLATKDDINDDAQMTMLEINPRETNKVSCIIETHNIVLARHPLANEKVYFRLARDASLPNRLCYVPLSVFVGGVSAMMVPKSFLFVIRKK